MSKYRNRKISLDGFTFDSVREANRWCELKLMQRAGEIRNLERQVKFVLIPAQYEYNLSGKAKGKLLERECAYIADFVYEVQDNRIHSGWRTVIEDAKGMKTEVYRIKRKLMLKEYGIRICEV